VAERDAYVLEMLNLIRSPLIDRSEDENRAAWERGWQQNLDEARAAGFAPHALKPKYFRGNRFLRFSYAGTNADMAEASRRLIAWAQRRR